MIKNRKKILIIGASNLQVPGILKAKEMGFETAVVDFDPRAMGVKYADNYYNVSTIDQEGVYEAARDFGADGIMTLATDMPMRSLAYACNKLNLVGIDYDTAVRATDKGEMIKAFEEYDVAHPMYLILENGKSIDDIVDKIVYPLIIKPTDNSGSRGVVLVHNKEELYDAISYSIEESREGNVILEEYMVGPEVSVEVIVLDGEPHILQITDKLTTGAPHFVEMGHSQPSRLSEEIQNEIRILASKACKAVGIVNGPAHAEIIVTENGPKMVEIGARMGGDSITTHLVPLSTGVDMTKATIQIACGQTPDIDKKINKASAIRFFNVSEGEIISISGVEEAKKIPGVKEIIFTKKVGDIVGDITSSNDRVASVITQADTPENAISICEKALQKVHVEIKYINE